MWFRSHFYIFSIFLNISFLAAQNPDSRYNKASDSQETGFKGIAFQDTLVTKQSLGTGSLKSGPLSDTEPLLSESFSEDLAIHDTLVSKQPLDTGPSIPGSFSDSLLEIALGFKGTPYRLGGRSSKGFDCSGFVHYLYAKFDMNLGFSCPAIAQDCDKIQKKEVQKGDLIFFKGRNIRNRTPGHVSIVYDVDSIGTIHMIHATQRGVVMDNLSKSAYYKPRLLFYARVKKTPNP